MHTDTAEPATLRQEFDKKGYVVLRGAVSPEDSGKYIRAIDALRPNFKKRTWTIPDGVVKHRAFWPVIFNERTLNVVRDLLGPDTRFLQHDDIHFGFSSFAWHRDSINRSFGDLPDWDEDDEPYRVVRVGYYFQPGEGGFRLGMIPGSHRPQEHFDRRELRSVERRITHSANLISKLRGVDRMEDDAEWIATEPGDAVIFDPRTIHTGSDFKGDKYSVFAAYGIPNRHYQQHYQYYRYLRSDLHYGPVDPDLVAQLEDAGLYGGEAHTIDRIEGAWIPSGLFRYISGFFK